MQGRPPRARQGLGARGGRADRRGYSLVAVLVAVVVLSIGLLSVSSTMSSLIRSQTEADVRSASVAIARSYLEQVRARDPLAIESEPAVAVGTDGVPAADGPLLRSLVVTEPQPSLLLVTVRVASRRDAVPVELITYVYRGTGVGP
jgi:type IV pilus assembly protein PilV